MSEVRLNAYRIMWLFVFFDLPTNTKTERRHATQFRKALEKDGFSMMQYSVYVRHCPRKRIWKYISVGCRSRCRLPDIPVS